MRHFVYFSGQAATSGKALSGKDVDLMRAGRMDIAIHSFIQAVYLSNDFRRDVVFHFVFYGMPDPPKHIEIRAKEDTELSKKDIAGLIKKILYKYREGRKTEVLPGCFIEKKGLLDVVEELKDKGNEIFVLDKRGENIRKARIPKDSAFVIGDHNGLPKKELKRLKNISKIISAGPRIYFASQIMTIINNELDIRFN